MSHLDLERLALTLELQALYADYCACIDERRYQDWPGFFTKDCSYRVVPRENFERGHPLATLAFESRGMLEDRVFAISQTLFHSPYYQRHIVGPVRIKDVSRTDDATVIRSEANYAVIRVKEHELPDLFNVGRYVDTVVRSGEALLFRERSCVFDSELIANSIIYPL